MISAHRTPDERHICPRCSHMRSSAASRAELVLCVWRNPDGSETHYCHHCNASGVAHQSGRSAHRNTRILTPPDNARIAATLWASALPATGSPVEVYNREARGIDLPLPATMRYLPARNGYPHAQITAFGLTRETEPGVLATPERVEAVHFTRLTPDGRCKLDKRMLGPVGGLPLVLAPPNDSLGLAITEGIEDALSIHAATGFGAWAAGSASHLQRLSGAVPDYIDCVNIIVDPDPAGENGAFALANALKGRGFEVLLKRLKCDG